MGIEFFCVVRWIMCSKWSDMVVCILSNFFSNRNSCVENDPYFRTIIVLLLSHCLLTGLMIWNITCELGSFTIHWLDLSVQKLQDDCIKLKFMEVSLIFLFLFLYPLSNCFWNCYLWIRMGMCDVIVFFYCDDEG